MVESKKLSAYWWWFDSQNSITRNSPWLQSTLAELDNKTESMLNLIEQEADSFAKRAEMYYKKRPELIKQIEDFYRTYRALALHYDHATKFEFDSCTRLLTRHQTSHPITNVDKSYDSYSDSVDLYHDQDSNESQTDDHRILDEESLSESKSEELMNLREEIERLKEENKIQKEMLVEKDEEKREAIRQLSLYVDSIKQENLNFKKRHAFKMQI
ncbi:putative protein Networked (NET), actin-binding (NAB) [Helianthus annuus]|uniref:NAB domain-containing protein n=1 Tax=Helianthus annuus TaxID=4232 RepID=A0A251TH12_HELAN|nr:protein NETWORKED 3C [Helianthus annuus]XP_021987552.1 protein NETWORKED 3C [Helianthus annuus]XP_021987553.1 protein NETWORKED 3C [Helianthus annuus]KAF5785145.1 putative protein Networked (NET), actin-binding (NAB) [Helianthus annuus]KAJ0528859.1 putative protein Networked (NET), actin-binding (NAB) [Helianthus annuus]KAJ0695775.1 putative protein Networked (NET), actin-binding (NAB) [Helianthus annuus]